ncbi:unnamed protein product [Vitrella brassicaformis CCMP3155]|uniref:EamA domain-containing protein n=1 Tax=Vitrella brassicaformis (strain CCMP3155) TaxID=1169540 RepID=A0A0G4EB38_VITBC|nr:unnamed protein product [Vitrella brassicaformis CCMP3155]|eukprot:CEL92463.1 unnamed protein product [Vitrella brassicaformis CCMP3155]
MPATVRRCASVRLSDRVKRTLTVLIGVIAITPDALLLRQVQHFSIWTIIFFRSALAAAVLLVVVLATTHSSRRLSTFTEGGASVLFCIVPFIVSMACFPSAIVSTTAANALGIYSSNPIFAALLAYLLLGERIAVSLAVAIVLVLTGIVLVFVADFRAGRVLGNVLALVTAAALAGYLVGIRYVGTRHPRVDARVLAVYALACSVVIVACVGIDMRPFSPSYVEMAWFVAMGGVCYPVAIVAVNIAPRYLHPAEVALYMCLETVLGPLLLFAVQGERPTRLALVGVSLVVVSLAGQSAVTLWIDYRSSDQATTTIETANGAALKSDGDGEDSRLAAATQAYGSNDSQAVGGSQESFSDV